ncbi:hypothetical protein [Geobacillus subterraneus]|uniref:Uncharacterized protein n=1 Tax=Geobacillus subterraneus TaxID=129338 RepID=A0A679FM85_9BACL|nr:hypothetical protein [Geobacillus subterraneus]BBW97073.1 hypothetical protein GsuE55_19060 [Geobacillus subterraneus]
MKGRIAFFFWTAAVIVAFILNLLGFMRLIPLWATMPLLFFCLLGLVSTWNRRHQFKGLPSKRMRL